MTQTADRHCSSKLEESSSKGDSSGLLSGSLRERLSVGQYTGMHRGHALSVIFTTGMRHAELRRISKSNLCPPEGVFIPSVKKGRGKIYRLTTWDYNYILSHSEDMAFLDSPSYQSLYKWIQRNGDPCDYLRTAKRRSIMNTARKLKIRELVASGESGEQLLKHFGWRTKAAIGYYL